MPVPVKVKTPVEVIAPEEIVPMLVILRVKASIICVPLV